MIWLRLFIAVIALTISSDLSAWGQPQKQINRNKRGRTISSAPSASAAPQVSAPSASTQTQPQQMQVNSPEGFYDCKGVANGPNKRDRVGGCCLPSEQAEYPCFKCKYTPNLCEKQTGLCGYAMTPCETQVQKCGATVVCNKCDGTMGGCGRCEGCRDCKTFRCTDTKGSYWRMFHNTGTNCGSAFELPNNTGGPVNLGHGTTFYRVDLFSQPPHNEEKKCYGPSDRATCADTGKRGYIYATNIAGELVTIAEERGKKSCTCNDGTITCN